MAEKKLPKEMLQNFRSLVSAFPKIDHEKIIKALKISKNNVEIAGGKLLTLKQ